MIATLVHNDVSESWKIEDAQPATVGWPATSHARALEHGHVHVWSVRLDQSDACVAAYSECLSAEERSRANRFHLVGDQQRYLVAHGVLRHLLAQYLLTSPSRPTFRVNAHGKPSLWTAQGQPPLHFNLAHSRNTALIAFAAIPVGVDVEEIREMPDRDLVAQGFFTPSEYAEFLTLSFTERTEGFFNCWTRKEAYLKATGQGITEHLQSFEVNFRSVEAPSIRQLHKGDSNRWALAHLAPFPGVTGALAIEMPSPTVVQQEWSFRVE